MESSAEMNDRDTVTVSRLAALAQPTRLNVFKRLMRAGPDGINAGALARELDVAPNTLSAHLAILARADLLQQRRDGRNIIYSVQVPAVAELVDSLVNDCCAGHPAACAPLETSSRLQDCQAETSSACG